MIIVVKLQLNSIKKSYNTKNTSVKLYTRYIYIFLLILRFSKHAENVIQSYRFQRATLVIIRLEQQMTERVQPEIFR
jgi:hypothetical protein